MSFQETADDRDARHDPLCAECDGFGDWLCEYHREQLAEMRLEIALDELTAHLEDAVDVELWLFEHRGDL